MKAIADGEAVSSEELRARVTVGRMAMFEALRAEYDPGDPVRPE
jgi:hypothetical protein